MAAMNMLFVEVFTEYGLSIVFLLLRFFARWWTAGFRAFDLGDAFAGAAMIFYSLETAGIYLLSSFGNNVGLNEKTAMEVPDKDVPRLTLGSKIVFMNWLWYITFIWSLKGVLLALYGKLGRDIVRQELMVKIVSIFCFFTWLGCMLTHILICTPPWKTWQIKPYPGDNCTVRGPDYIVIAVLNVLSDLSIMIIPMPLLWRVQIPLRRKLALATIFSLGIFVMIATILRAYYSLLSLDTLPIALGWASRETFCATVAVCAPGIKPLFSKSRWLKGSKGGSRTGRRTGSNNYLEFSKSNHGTNSTHVTSDANHSGYSGVTTVGGTDFELTQWPRRAQAKLGRKYSSDHSDERVIMEEEHEKDIFITTEYTVERDENEHRV